MLAPVLIVALMRSANETFAQNLASPVGVAAVTGALVLLSLIHISMCIRDSVGTAHAAVPTFCSVFDVRCRY